MENNRQVTETDIQKLITDIKLPPTILYLFNGVCSEDIILRNFRRDYAAPYRILCLTKTQQNNYLIDRYKPILCYAGSTIYAYDIVLGGYIKYSVELMNKNPNCLTWDGLFVRDILFWWELEISDDDILYIGNLFGLKHTKEILDSIYSFNKKNGFSSFQDSEYWINSMIDKINGRVV